MVEKKVHMTNNNTMCLVVDDLNFRKERGFVCSDGDLLQKLT